MIHRNTLLALAIGTGVLTLAACSRDAAETTGSTPDNPAAATATDASADAFVKRVNDE